MRREVTPLLWGLFSAGGSVAALVFPIHLILTGVAIPLGIIPAPSYDSALSLMGHSLTKLYLFILIAFPLFHWAHRFRYTLYDGLQIKHLTLLIVVICYGSATIGTLLAAYFLWSVP